jgi:pimeloyl-ACP methyl ester carboxylesterase
MNPDRAWLPEQVRSTDGTPLAVWTTGHGPSLVLVHGTTADHTTWRTIAPRLADAFTLAIYDRRGRGESGDAATYELDREFADVLAVAALLPQPVALFGHSFGGLCALGAAATAERTGIRIAGVVAYEPALSLGPQAVEMSAPFVAELEALAAAGQSEELLRRFLTTIVGMSDAEWADYRTSEVWEARLAAAGTVPREFRAALGPAADPDRLTAIREPVLFIVGQESPPLLRLPAETLARRIRGAQLAEIPGAKHSAHHSHADRVAELIRTFLADRF